MYSDKQKTFLANIRCGLKPVRKVYLGGRVVWRCVDVVGDADSSSYVNAYVYLPIRSIIIGESQSNFDYKANARVLELSFMTSKIEMLSSTESNAISAKVLESISNIKHSTYTHVIGRLIEAIYAYTKTNNKSFNNSVGHSLDALPFYSSLSIKPDIEAFGGSNTTKQLISKTDIMHTASSTVGVNLIQHVNGDFAMYFGTKAAGLTADSIGVSSNIESKFYTTAIGGTTITVCTKAFTDSTSFSNSVMRTMDALFMYGDGIAKSAAAAISTLYRAILMIGDDNFNFNGKAEMSNKLAALSKGDTAQLSNGDSFINRYFVQENKGNINITSHGSGCPTIWYPPIGDGIPLVESDGVDITINGDILEIQQANIVIENKILEVRGYD